MKKYVALLNLALLLSIASSIVFPAVHSFEHIAASYSKTQCFHDNPTGKPQITHEHSHLDHCYLCEYSLGNFVAPEIFAFSFVNSYRAIPYFAYVSETPHSFSGTIAKLRGPPDFSI